MHQLVDQTYPDPWVLHLVGKKTTITGPVSDPASMYIARHFLKSPHQNLKFKSTTQKCASRNGAHDVTGIQSSRAAAPKRDNTEAVIDGQCARFPYAISE